jgi:hypothetical protein
MAGRPPEPDDEREPTPDADDIDVRFADITASLGDLTVPPDEGGDDASAVPAPAAGAQDAGPGPRDYVLRPPSGPDPDRDDDAGYVPPEPPPLTGSDPLLTIAWVGVAAAIALVLLYLVLWRTMPGVLLGLAGVVFLLSVAVLLWRMPSRREPDDYDNGAVV